MNEVELLKLALSGDVEAQVDLGSMYFCQKDYPNALKWLNEAASKNHPDALMILGCHYYGRDGVQEDLAKSFELLNKASKYGQPNADVHLAEFFFYGDIVEQDSQIGQLILANAANNKHCGLAANVLADILYFGIHKVGIDHKKAIQWHKKAFELGNSVSAYRLWQIYEGRFDPRELNPKKAYRWARIVLQLLDEGKLDDEDFN